MADQFPELRESDLTSFVDQKNSDQMIKQLLNLLIAKYCDLSVPCWSIICLSLWLQQIIDLFATDKVVIIKCGQQIGFKTQTRYVQHADWGLNCHIWPIYWQQKKEIETIQCKKPKSWNFIGEKVIQFLDRWVPFASPCKLFWWCHWKLPVHHHINICATDFRKRIIVVCKNKNLK